MYGRSDVLSSKWQLAVDPGHLWTTNGRSCTTSLKATHLNYPPTTSSAPRVSTFLRNALSGIRRNVLRLLNSSNTSGSSPSSPRLPSNQEHPVTAVRQVMVARGGVSHKAVQEELQTSLDQFLFQSVCGVCLSVGMNHARRSFGNVLRSIRTFWKHLHQR